MVEEIRVEPSEELAYWTGVAQSDGCLTVYTVKRDKYVTGKETRVELSLGVSSKSLPMLKKFRNLSKIIFNRHNPILKVRGRDEWKFKIGVKSLLQVFRETDIKLSSFFIPPIWVIEEPKYFGAYLAGLIDGDGNVTIKRPRYPQCTITIYSGSRQNILAKSITKILSCSVYQLYERHLSKLGDRIIKGTTYKLGFYASSKTAKFILDYVVPYLQLAYKKKILQSFINKRYPLIAYTNIHVA